MHVGFTGSRVEPTEFQLNELTAWLMANQPTVLHHGDCVGSDAAAHRIALSLGIKVIIHPPQQDKLRAFCQGAVKVYPPQPYLRRDRNIVHDTRQLLALPRGTNIVHSGTWYTINFARQLKRPVWLCYPQEIDNVSVQDHYR